MPVFADTWLRERDQYTNELLASPYDASIYLKRARCHEELLYPEFAAGDAYKALLLTDEVLDEAGEYHEQAFEALQNAQKSSGNRNDGELNGSEGLGKVLEQCAVDKDDGEVKPSWHITIAESQSRDAYRILARTLIECGDLKTAWDFAERGSRVSPTDAIWQDLQEEALQNLCQTNSQNISPWDIETLNPRKDLPQNGHARREIYPWNMHEPERYTASDLSLLNAELSKIAPKCEVRAVELPLLIPSNSVTIPVSESSQQIPPKTHKQLGLFATADIPPYETIFHEPSILTANNRLYDTLCDACSSPLPITTSPLPTCPSCDDTVFCSSSCLARAQELYHPAICGHPDFDLSARDPSPAAATDALYLLLLARTIAMAETQNLHPLDLREIKYLWGDFSTSSTPTLPFSFQTHIQTPLHLLSNLNRNIFAPETLQRYDFWVINTLMAKYRGVASAKMDPRTGMPEVCAVHWRWCLANHSCSPNVRWEWPARAIETPGGEKLEERGSMALVVRGGDEVVQWGSRKREGGIKKGQEILNHYCDVDLPVEARREWAAGALGGVCVCERCVWEDGEQGKGGLEDVKRG